MKRKPLRILLVLLLPAVLLVAVTAGVIHSGSFRGWLQGKLETVLTEATGRPVTLLIRDLAPLRLRAVVEGFTIGGASPDALPLVSAASINLDANWSAVFGRRADLSSLTVSGLRVDLEQLPLDLPGKDPVSPPFSIEDFVDLILVDRLELENGWLHFGGADLPLDILAEDLALSAGFRRLGRGYQGTLSVGAGGLSITGAGDFPVELQTGFTLGPKTITLTDIRLKSAGVLLSGSGEITDWALPAYSASFEAEVTPGALQVAALDDLGFDGDVSLIGTVEGLGGEIRAAASVKAGRLDVSSVEVRELACALTLEEGQLRVTDFTGEVLGTRIEGGLSAAATNGLVPFTAELQLASSDPDPLVRWFSPNSRPGSRGSFTGRLDLTGTAYELKALTGSLAVRTEDLVLPDASRFPMAIKVEAEFKGGVADVGLFTLTAPGTAIAGSGTLAPESPSSIGFTADVSRLEPLNDGIGAVAGLMGGSAALPQALLRLRGSLRVDGELGVPSLDGFDATTLSGSLNLVAEGVTLAGAPTTVLNASLETGIAGGEIMLRRTRIEAAGVAVGATGGLGVKGASSLSLQAAVPHIEQSLPAVRGVLAALDQPAAVLEHFAALSGSVQLDARLDGPWNELDGSALLAADELAFGDLPLGRLRAEAISRRGRVEMNGTLDGRGGGIEISGRMGLGGTAGIPSRVGLLFHQQSLEPFVIAAGLDLPLSGIVDGEAAITFPGPEARANLVLSDGAVAGIPLDAVTCELLLAGRRLEVTRARLAAAGGSLSVSGVLESGVQPEGLVFEGSGFQLGALLKPFDVPLEMDGRLSLSGSVTGALDQPRLTASVKLAEISGPDWSVPELEGRVLLDRKAFDIHLASADGKAVADVSLGFEEGALWTGDLRYPLHLAGGSPAQQDAQSTDSITVDGTVLATLQMNGADPTTLAGHTQVAGLRIEAAGKRLEATGPLQVTFVSGVALIEPFRLEGPDTGLDVAGSVTLAEPWETSLTVSGTADLVFLQGFSEQLRAEGLAEFELAVNGPARSLDTEGDVRIRNGRLRHPDIPVALEKIEAAIQLRPGHWQLSRLKMSAGGGTVTVSGEAAVDGLQPESYRFEMTGRRVRLAYPEGTRSELDADLLLAHEGDGPGRLSGDVRIISGLYDEDVRIEQQLLTRTRAVDLAGAAEPGPLDRLNLDLRVTAEDGLWIRNNLASMETRVGLQVRGSVGRPDITGRVEALEGGTVTFRGVDYSIVRGSIDYPGGPAAEPQVDIQAETSKSDYDIRLTVTGPLENLKFDLSSTPPLSQTDIITLLVTGKTRDELGGGGGGLSQDEAAVYLSGKLTDRVAPALKRSLGLDEVSVNPVLMGGQADPTARVTVGKALTPRLFVTYSSLMGSERQDVYQAKYRLTDHFNLLGTRDEDGSLAGDLVYRARLYRGPPQGDSEGGAGDRERRRISGIDFRGNRNVSARRLRRLLGVDRRDRYHRSRVLGGLERIRDWYSLEGFPGIDVEHQVIGKGDSVDLVITVDEGDRVRIRVPGAPRPRRPLRRELYRLWSRSIFREDLLEEGARLVIAALRDRGYIRATVEPSLLERAPGEREIIFTVNRGARVKVDEIRFSGIHGVAEEDIRARMLTRQAGLRSIGGFGPQRLDEDLEAIRNYYATAGFLDARVRSQVEDLPDSDRVLVTVEIEEGIRYWLEAVGFSGNAAFTDETLLAETGLHAGSPFNDAMVREAERKLAVFYDSKGYNSAVIRSSLKIDRETGVVEVLFQEEEGPALAVEEVDVICRGITNPEVIRRELELWAGQPFSTRKADQSQYNLYRTGLFRSVGYEILPGETAEGRRVVFTVEESPNLHFDYGLGFNSDYGIRISGNAAHSNVFGRRLYVGLGGRYGGEDSQAQLVVRQPDLWGSEVEGLGRAFWEEEDRVNFNAARLGLALQGTRHYHQRRYTLIWGYGLEDLTLAQRERTTPLGQPLDESADPLFDPRVETEVRLGSARIDGARDTRDAFLWPSAGSYTRAELGLYDSAFLSEAEYFRGFIQWNRYLKVSGSTVWTSAVRLGLAEPYGGTEYLPISERFFTGGESSIRGFRYDSLQAVGAPYVPGVTGSDSSTGGNALFLFNQELSVRLAEPFYMLLFYDAGNLFWRVSDFDITDLRHSAGLGLRLKTPVGPLRLEYGWKLDRRDGESVGRLHFSFGMPF